MFRSPQAGDWAADDDDDVEITPIHMPSSASTSSSPPPAAPAKKSQPDRSSNSNARSNNSSRQEKGSSNNDNSNSSNNAGEPPRNRWGRTPEEAQAGRRNYDSGTSRDNRDYNRSGSGGYDRDSRGGYDRRDNSNSGGYGRDGGDRYGGGGGGYSRDRDAGDRGYGGGRDSGYGGGRDDRYGGRDSGRRQQQHVELPVEQGIVVAIKESFGFVSGVDREGDLFFHITEAPVDVQLQDEVEFRVKYNQRSAKEMACQLVILPKGTIVMEDVSDEFFDGVVTRGLRSGGGASSYNNSSREQQREESHGVIEIAAAAAAKVDAESKKSDENKQDATPVEAAADGDEKESAAANKPMRRVVVRFNSESMNPAAGSKQEDSATAAGGESKPTEQQGESTESKANAAKPPRRPKKGSVPQFGDEVRFRIATHRKTGAKRAVELTVTTSAKAKLEKEIEAKLHTMTREQGIVERMKSGGGFIKCCDRPEEVYFPLHEVRASEDEQVEADTTTATEGDEAGGEAGEKKGRGGKQNGKKKTGTIALRDGDEVSFFVYEDKDDDSSRSRPRLTALRVQKLLKGTVSFEDLIRSNVEGVVAKGPKEPRNGPEVIGLITPTSAGVVAGENKENAAIANEKAETTGTTNTEVGDAKSTTDVPGSPKKSGNKKTTKDAKKKGSNKNDVPFRLSDAQDMSYSPHVGDLVVFDEVFEKRSGKIKAVNVRVLKLNQKNRETGTISSVRDDFGFIKCADRAMDAYFRITDVMSASSRDFRNGTEVAFDMNFDPSKPDKARATRVEILPQGTVQWETVVEEGLLGEVIALPPPTRQGAASGSRGGNEKTLLKVTNGRIRFAPSCEKKFWLDFLPEVKQKIDNLFLLANGEVQEELPAEEKETEAQVVSEDAGDDNKEKEKKKRTPKKQKEIKLAFPSSLTKSERFVIHQYCDALGIQHQSSGEGPNRRLELVATRKVPAKPVAADELPALEVEFKWDDLAEVRYSPRLGDRVKLNLVISKRTKQFSCKSVVCVEAAAAPVKAPKKGEKGEKKAVNAPQRDEGFIVSVRSEGFGFIQPANAVGNSSADENLFFHIKEVTTGETLESLKEGMEVQFTTTFDEVKKKTRAVSIAVVPAGTIKKVEVVVLKGVVSRPSLLNPMKSSKSSRFGKNAGKQAAGSSVGKIRVVAEGVDVSDENEQDDEEDDAEEEGEEQQEEDATGKEGEVDEQIAATTAEGSETPAVEPKDPTAKKPKAKPSKPKQKESLYAYNIKDIADPSVVLREGDEVEFTAIVTSKGPRASKIRVVALHAKQGVVTKILEDFSGLIRVDGDNALEIPFLARNVLRGDVLSEGDRVEFAHMMEKPNTTRKIGTAAAKAELAENAAENAAAATDEQVEEVPEPEKSFVGQAMSVLRLSAPGANAESRTRAPRTVNSSLLQAMRQVGASAVVASRMAKGPDGTRGFKDGWRAAAAAEAEPAAVAVASE